MFPCDRTVRYRMNESVLIVSEFRLTQSVAAKNEEPGDIFPREMILRKCLQ